MDAGLAYSMMCQRRATAGPRGLAGAAAAGEALGEGDGATAGFGAAVSAGFGVGAAGAAGPHALRTTLSSSPSAPLSDVRRDERCTGRPPYDYLY